MGQFGQELRRERESRGVALESIAGVTKISSRHLQALEEEQFKNLPGGVLSKGIVRGYARVVGLDEDAWVGRYLEAYHGSGQVKDDDAGWIEFAENVGRARKGDLRRSDNLSRWAGVVMLFTLLLLFGWYVAHFVSGREALAQDMLRPSAVASKAAPVAEQEPARQAVPASRAYRHPAAPVESDLMPDAGAAGDTAAADGQDDSSGGAPAAPPELRPELGVSAKPAHRQEPPADAAGANDPTWASSQLSSQSAAQPSAPQP